MSVGVIVLTGLFFIFFLIERFFDMYWRRHELSMEQKKLWSQHVMASITGLHVIERDSSRMVTVLKNARSTDELTALFQFLDEPPHVTLQEAQPVEPLNSGYIILFDEIVRPRMQKHVLDLLLERSNISARSTRLVVDDPLLEWFARYLELMIAYVNLVRLKVTHGFSDRKSFGHVMIRSPLMKVINGAPRVVGKRTPVNPIVAKKLVAKEKYYHRVLTAIHQQHETLMQEWQDLMKNA